jgi:sugar fermentation stimulation protein A
LKFDPPLRCGRLVRRYKRFLVDVDLDDGRVVTMHCPNTGAMSGCAKAGSRVWFSTHTSASRKYAHTLEIVETASGDFIGVHSARANGLVAEALAAGEIVEFAGRSFAREVMLPDGNGRVDFRIDDDAQGPCYLEVKSVTLACGDGWGAFPDAPSLRARRHVASLIALRRAGTRSALLFCVQHTGIERVRAASEVDADYAHALGEARAAGVEVLAYRARITPEAQHIAEPLETVC